MRVLGLDLATTTGFAIGALGSAPVPGVHVLPSTKQDIGSFLVAFDDWLSALVDREQPEAGFFEAPILSQHTMTARKLMCLAGETERIFVKRRILIAEVNISSAKLFFAGHGHADKPMMIEAAEKRGWTVGVCPACRGTCSRRAGKPCSVCEGTGKDHNQADAMAIWSFGCASLKPGIIRAAPPAIGPVRAEKKKAKRS